MPADGRIEFGYEECPAAVARWLADVGALTAAAAASDPFANCSGAVERDPIAPQAARTADPYSGFSWEARRRFPEFEWDGRRDRNGRITGEGCVAFANGDEVGGFFRNGVREGHGWTATRCAFACPRFCMAKNKGRPA